MARPPAADPKVAITIRLPRSTMDRLTAQASAAGVPLRELVERALTTGSWLEPAAVRQAARRSPGAAITRLAGRTPAECPHPVNRRLGDQCAECGASVKAAGGRR